MELYEFNALDFNQRAETLWANGTFIINLKQGEHAYNLYSFFGYFVEVTYSQHENNIIDIRPFKKCELLNKYLDVIDVRELV